MKHALPLLNAVASALLLALVAAPSTASPKADAPTVTTAKTQIALPELSDAYSSTYSQDVVEYMPDSQAAWEFDPQTGAIKGSNGIIWQGGNLAKNLLLTPMTFAAPPPGYGIQMTPKGPDEPGPYWVAPPPGQYVFLEKPAPIPNTTTILPPGKSKPQNIPPKVTP